jgi:catalase
MTSTQPNPTTTDAGIPVESDEHSLTVGPDGPLLLHDHYAIDQMAQWNRERVPERQPHAKGSGAFGRFEVTSDVSAYTKAAVFQPGTTTDIAARFSTVAGERQPRHVARPPRLRGEVPHHRGRHCCIEGCRDISAANSSVHRATTR